MNELISDIASVLVSILGIVALGGLVLFFTLCVFLFLNDKVFEQVLWRLGVWRAFWDFYQERVRTLRNKP